MLKTQHVQEIFFHSHSFWFYKIHYSSFSKHVAESLISEGTTRHWVEYIDGCAYGYGIHSLMFVIVLFCHLIFLLRSNRYVLCSNHYFIAPFYSNISLCTSKRFFVWESWETISFSCGIFKLIKKLNRALPFQNVDSEVFSGWYQSQHNLSEVFSCCVYLTHLIREKRLSFKGK